MTSKICVDASLVVALLVPERLSQAAFALWETWIHTGQQIVAPLLLRFEVISAIYLKAFRQLISVPDARLALGIFRH